MRTSLSVRAWVAEHGERGLCKTQFWNVTPGLPLASRARGITARWQKALCFSKDPSKLEIRDPIVSSDARGVSVRAKGMSGDLDKTFEAPCPDAVPVAEVKVGPEAAFC